MAEHRRGSDKCKLTQALAAIGIGFALVRTWEFDNPKDAFREERKIKRVRSYATRCPKCRDRAIQIKRLKKAIKNVHKHVIIP